MADKKLEKALYGPSMTEVALGAVLGLIVGVVACCVYLVFKPVALVKEMPAKDKQSVSVVYYVPGAESNAKSKGWQAKQKQFVAGKSIVVVEDELNAWSTSIGGPPAPPPPAPGKGAPAKPGAPAAPKPPGEGIFLPGTPNFHMSNGKMQIGFKCTLNWYGLMTEVTVLTTGTIKKSGDQFAFAPETVFLGSCPVHLLPGAVGPLVAHLTEKRKTPDEIRAAWAKLSDVTIDGSTLKLTVQ